MECRLKRGFAIVDGGFPADFNAGEQVGLGADRFEQSGRFEPVLAKDLFVGVESHRGAAPVGGRADLFDRPKRQPARETLFVQLFVAGHLHHHGIRQRVDHRGADPMQTTRGLVGLARELATCVQGTEDHLKCRFVRKLGMRINRDAAAIVADSDRIVFA